MGGAAKYAGEGSCLSSFPACDPLTRAELNEPLGSERDGPFACCFQGACVGPGAGSRRRRPVEAAPASQTVALGTHQAGQMHAGGLRPRPVWEAPRLPPLILLAVPT